MDVLASSNFERLVYDICDDCTEYALKISQNQTFSLKPPVGFEGFYATEKEVRKAIKKVFDNHGYLIDPHTAVAYAAHEGYLEKHKGNREKNVILATASPYKFVNAVMSSIDGSYDGRDDFYLLEKMAELTKREVPSQIAELQKKEKIHDETIEIDKMESVVLKTVSRGN
jgi:threonine synthase